MPELPGRRGGTAIAVALSLAGGLLAGVLSYVGAFMLWHGISAAIGRGDPTWNDGEAVWVTAVGLLYTGMVSFGIYQGVRVLSFGNRPGIRQVIALLWVLPTAALHLLFAASVLGLND